MSGHGSSRNTRFKICDRKFIFSRLFDDVTSVIGKNADIGKNNQVTMIFFISILIISISLYMYQVI